MNKLMVGAVLAITAICASGSALARGGKPVVGVIEFKNETGAGWWRGGVGWELSGMLANELAATGDFHVVERKKLQNVLEEQNLAASGRVRAHSGPRIGQLTGAQYLVDGTVTAYEENTSSTGGRFSFHGIGLGGKSTEAYLAIDLRVINAETGDIDFSRTVEGHSKGGGISVGIYRGGFGGELEHEKNTPAGKAIRAALVEATDYLDCVMVKRDGCIQDFKRKEQRRRASDRKALDLD